MYFVVFSCALLIAVASNDAITSMLQRALTRIVLGIESFILREDVPGLGGIEARVNWMNLGINGWIKNPVFGHGVEAFRDHYGTTSHSTPVDLLYNSGLIGFFLFYVIFVSMLFRLKALRDKSQGNLYMIIFGMLICFIFISFSGTMHYSVFLAVFIAISTALLSQYRGQSCLVNMRMLKVNA